MPADLPAPSFRGAAGAAGRRLLVHGAIALIGILGTASAVAASAAASSTAADPASAATAAFAPAASVVAARTRKCVVAGMPDPLYLVLDDAAAPQARREAAFRGLEQCAADGVVSAQDALGSLYWMGRELPGALTPRDAAKAEMYLSNAAAHGNLMDMAKMAEIELALGHQQAAMTWAKIYGYYDTLSDVSPVTHQAFLASLLMRIEPGFDQTKMPAVVGDASAFVTRYDAGIRAFNAARRQQASEPDAPRVAQSQFTLHDLLASDAAGDPGAGLADYLVAFGPDGAAIGTWLLDALPDPAVGRFLRPVATHLHVQAAPGRARRFALVPLRYSDGQYSMPGSG